MWYRTSQNKGYKFVMPQEKSPWTKNVILDPKQYGSNFSSWVDLNLHPENPAAGEGGFKQWSAGRGGATQKGITQAEYDLFRKSQNQPQQSVQKISGDEVRQILHRNYWAKLGAEKLPPMVANVVTTMGLLRNTTIAAKALQEAIKKFVPTQQITGNVLDQTVKNVNQVAKNKKAEYDLAITLLNELKAHLDAQKNMGGYKARMDALKQKIDQMYSQNPSKQTSQLQQEITTELQNLFSTQNV